MNVIRFGFEDHWIADLYSFLTEKRATLFIEALEDSELLLLHRNDLEQLFDQIPSIERLFRKLYAKAYINTLQHLNESYSEPADVRYEHLLKNLT